LFDLGQPLDREYPQPAAHSTLGSRSAQRQALW
jgi:hypothetical protein